MKWTTRCLCLAVAAGVAGGSGCAVSRVYNGYTGGALGVHVSPKRKWKASGSISNPKAAVDDDLMTAARTNIRAGGAELTLDLQEECLFQMIVLDHGESQHGHARRIGVDTSLDGRVFQPRHAAPGTRRITHLVLPKPVLARYVRLRVITPGRRPWSVAEVYIQ